MPLTSFFNNHKQNRSATALPTGNNASSSSLPSPNHQQGGLLAQQEYQAYSPPPESLSARQQFAQAQAAQQQQQHQEQSSRGPARHQSISGTPSGAQYGSRQDPVNYNPAPLIRQSSGAAESQQRLLPYNNTADNISYSSNSSTVYEPIQQQQQQQQQQQPQHVPVGDAVAPAPVPAKSTLRKPLLSKEPSSSGGGGISGLFHRHKHQDQEGSGGIGRRLSTRKSNASTPQQSPSIPQQIDEDRYAQETRSPRPQSLLPPKREQPDALAGISNLRRSDTDAPAYGPRSPQIQPPLGQHSAGQPQGQPQPYYNVATGQYESAPAPQQQSIAPAQQHRQPQSPPPPQLQQQQSPTPQSQPQHQPPPQQQYPGHKSQPSQSQTQAPPSYDRNSKDFPSQDIRNIHINTKSPASGLSAQPQTNQPVSPGASIHTVDTMPGNNPNNVMQQSVGGDGRATPTSGKPEGNGGSGGMTPIQVQALMTEFDALQSKYRKVKNLYFDRAAEIERLQNTMANQRLSQSRTALDDNEYSSRFERLDGAIKNLAFEIRQSWKVIPGWLQPVVNPGAEVKGGREMTVVGRAAISRWVVDEILDRFFHPGLEPAISSSLKNIENGIRRNSPQPQSIEEDDNLSAKVCAWRMSTVDGIAPVINSPQGMENRQRLTEILEEKLTASLAMHLNDPLPGGLPGGVKMIIEISVGLAANLPLESRDVRVWYPLPGEKFDSVFMRAETGLQPLIAPPAGAMDGMDNKATITVDGKPISQIEQGNPPPPPKDDAGLHPSNSIKGSDIGKKQSVFKGIKGKLSGAASGGPQLPPQQLQNQSQISLAESPATTGKPENTVTSPPPQAPQQTPGQEKVRVAGFMAVEVRGKSILIKAPVWT